MNRYFSKLFASVIWLKYFQYGLKHQSINQSIKDVSDLWLRVSVLRLELFNVLKLKVQFVGESDPVLGVGFKGHILECCVINNRPSNIRGECHPAKLFNKKEKGMNGPYVHYANIGQYKHQVVFAIHQWKVINVNTCIHNVLSWMNILNVCKSKLKKGLNCLVMMLITNLWSKLEKSLYWQLWIPLVVCCVTLVS